MALVTRLLEYVYIYMYYILSTREHEVRKYIHGIREGPATDCYYVYVYACTRAQYLLDTNHTARLSTYVVNCYCLSRYEFRKAHICVEYWKKLVDVTWVSNKLNLPTK